MTVENCIFPLASHSTKLCWATDIHLDFIGSSEEAWAPFINMVKRQQPKVLVLTGDIDTALPQKKVHNLGVIKAVEKIQELVGCHVFFVLGNHDFYGGSIKDVRARAAYFSPEIDHIWHLKSGRVVELNPTTALIGTDGWYDGQSGDLDHTNMLLNDFFFIDEIRLRDETELKTPKTKQKLIALAQEGVDQVNKQLPTLFRTYQKVILATHVPPFRESCLYKGKPSSDDAAPFFVNQMLGETLLEIMQEHPLNKLVVLCGHSHDPATYKPLTNLTVLTGGAKYEHPKPQAPIKL